MKTIAVIGLLMVSGAVVIKQWPAEQQTPPHVDCEMAECVDCDTAPVSTVAQAARTPLSQFDVKGLTIPANDIRAGGPPKDGIPSISKPKTAAAADADFLKNDERVLAITIDKESRAYPVNVLTWHEAVNDVVGEIPVAVIYCPLCDSFSVVDRRIKDKTFEFGISGLLYNSNVLLYDRTDQALWSQVGLTAVSGPHAGQSLRHLPFEITTYAKWLKANPKGTVMTKDTGHTRDYSRNPYASYFQTDRLMFPPAKLDKRLPAKTPIIGIKSGEVIRAYTIGEIEKAKGGRLEVKVDAGQVVLHADGRGSVRVVESPETVQVVHTFWFAWAAFHPKSELIGAVSAPAGSTSKTTPAPKGSLSK